MRLFKPVIFADIETTGLDSRECSILEIAMIFDDIGTYGGIQKELHIHIESEDDKWEPGVKEIHKNLLKKRKNIDLMSQVEAKEVVHHFLKECSEISKGALNLVGKRTTDLIYPFLKNQGFAPDKYIYHQHLDIPSLYYIELRGLLSYQKIAQIFNLNSDGSAISDARLSQSLFMRKLEQELF